MTPEFNPKLDLSVDRIIKASPAAIWSAWTTPAKLEKWWLPAPLLCRVDALDTRPGGAFITRMSEPGGEFGPHVEGCFLELVENERLVFTTCLLGGWRPAEKPFMTAVITIRPHEQGSAYTARAMHADAATRDTHDSLGFHDGWGTVTDQLARLVEG